MCQDPKYVFENVVNLGLAKLDHIFAEKIDCVIKGQDNLVT